MAPAEPKKKEVSHPLVPLLGDNLGTTVAFSRWGRGGVVVLSDSWPLANQGIARDDNFVLVLNALRRRDPGRRLTVTFDEYHQGYGKAPGILSLLGMPARLGLAQLGLAFLLLLFAVSRRFGRPVPLVEGGRERSEYLSSMSALLRRGRAVEFVRVELGRRFLEDTARLMGLAPHEEPERILQVAATRRPDKVEALRRLVASAGAEPPAHVDEALLLRLAQEWHGMRKELAKTR